MGKNTIVTFFTVIFMAFIVAPSIITLVNDSIDTSVFYSMAEEEEKGSENLKNIQIFLSAPNSYDCDFSLNESENNLEYFSKKYTKPHLNLISPPPDLS